MLINFIFALITKGVFLRILSHNETMDYDEIICVINIYIIKYGIKIAVLNFKYHFAFLLGTFFRRLRLVRFLPASCMSNEQLIK